MQVHATTNKVLFTKGTEHGWDVVEVRSKSNPDVKYTVDVTHGRCSCPAWKFGKVDANGMRKPCKHLVSLGFKQVMGVPQEVAEPKGNQQKAAETNYDSML